MVFKIIRFYTTYSKVGYFVYGYFVIGRLSCIFFDFWNNKITYRDLRIPDLESENITKKISKIWRKNEKKIKIILKNFVIFLIRNHLGII